MTIHNKTIKSLYFHRQPSFTTRLPSKKLHSSQGNYLQLDWADLARLIQCIEVKKILFEILENSSTEKVTTRGLYFTTSLVVCKQKLSMVLLTITMVLRVRGCEIQESIVAA